MTRVTVVCCSELAFDLKFGRIVPRKGWLHSSAGDTGKNCDNVRMARLRTAGRECGKSRVMAVRGCGFYERIDEMGWETGNQDGWR